MLRQSAFATSGSPLADHFTHAKMERLRAQIDESGARYLQQLDTADRQEPSHALAIETIAPNAPDRRIAAKRQAGLVWVQRRRELFEGDDHKA